MFKQITLISSILLVSACGGGDSGDGRVAVTASASAGGNITPTSQRVDKGSQVTLMVQPDTNYAVQNVTGCGGSLVGNTYRTGIINADCTVRASFIIKPFEASITGISETVDEGASGTISISTSNVNSVVVSSMGLVDASSTSVITLTKINETLYSYTVADTDRDHSITINWTAQDGTDITRQQHGSFSFSIINRSFAEPLARIKAFAANYQRMVNLTEEKSLLSALRDIAKVLNNDTKQLVASAEQSSDISEFTSAFEAMSSNLTSYLNGQNNDMALQTQFEETLARFNNYAASNKREINTYLTMLAAEGKAPLTAGDFYINAELGSVSLFIGNTALGTVQDNQWLFNDDVAYIGGLIANTDCDL